MDTARLNLLLDRYVDGVLTSDEKTELERMLLADPQARALFWERAGFNSVLREHGAQSWGSAVAFQTTSTKAPRFAHWRRIVWTGVAAAVVLAGLAIWNRVALLNSDSASLAADESTSDAVAVLTQAVDARWETGNAPKVGASLQSGTLKLQSGLAQIEFFSGGNAVLEGPAEIKLISPLEAYLVSGKLRVHVPAQARGFRVRSAETDVVDLGTEFGIQAGMGKATEVHVFDGKVELYTPGTKDPAPALALTEGHGVRVDSPGRMTGTDSASNSFVSSAEMNRRAGTQKNQQAQKWQSHAGLVQKFGASLLRFYDFQPEQTWERVLKSETGNAAVVGSQWAEGRWPGKGALEFRRVGDRVCLEVSGDFDSFTMLASVRVDGFDNRYNGIFMSDDFGPGAIHWQIARDGTITLGVQGEGSKNGINYTTPVIFGPETLGQWVSLAVVVDSSAHTVTQYVDGRIVYQKPITHSVKIRPGKGQLGNWGHTAKWKSVPVRNFCGRMDEFIMLSSALSGDGIRSLASFDN